ncbi:MAG TPA: hypothetical protein VNX21_00010 [Candidatus Thermoplasmatota archaeon]|nr:hypothetical protein [Candidatus Thermoplasmatota archaeon]
MHSLKAKLVQIGTSTGVVIPKKLALALGFAPGIDVKARFTMASKPVQRPVIAMSGGRSMGVIVPVRVLVRLGWARGDEVDVPFLEWKAVRGERGSPVGPAA